MLYFQNEDQALEALKEKSPKLYEKAKALHTMVKEKIDSLKAEAKTFVTGVSVLMCIIKTWPIKFGS